MSERDAVAIVGAGRFGLALANAVASAGRPVTIWSATAGVVDDINQRHATDRLPEVALAGKIRATSSPEQVAAAARLIVVTVSSTAVRERLRALGDHLDGNALVVHAIGALTESGGFISQVIMDETPVLRVGALAGPALWRDLVSGRFSSMVVASRFNEVTSEARRLLGVPPVLRLYSTGDLAGVELAAALSGAYTIAVGLSDGLGLGPGPRAVLITRALAEASRLGRATGAEPRTFTGLAGLGNILVRTQSEHARDYELGKALARGQAPEQPSQRSTAGTRSTLAGLRLAEQSGVRVPVLRAVAAVLTGELTPVEAARVAADTVADEE